MAVFKTGDMWERYETVGLFLVTTCNVIKLPEKRLVMGAGIAKQACIKFPGIDLAFGNVAWSIVSDEGDNTRVKQDYHLLISKHWPKRKLGAFQTKRHYKYDASLDLIHKGVIALKWWSIYHSDTSICLNYPGVGLGNLSREDVYPIISLLPNNVEIWSYE